MITNRRVYVYVKHFLTNEGKVFFEDVWFPKVLAKLKEQAGFISIERREDVATPDCIDIKLIFKDENTLNDWIDVPEHDSLIEELTPYRSRKYWKAVLTTDPEQDPETLDWEVIEDHA